MIRLRIDPELLQKQSDQQDDPHGFFSRPEPQAPCENYVYEELLSRDVKKLAEAAPCQTVEILVETLAEAIRLSSHHQDGEKLYDASDFWCRDLRELHPYEHSPKSHLAHALTAACETLITQEPGRFPELYSALQRKPSRIFRRLIWFLSAKFPEVAVEAMKKEITEADCFDDGEYGYEFALMLKAASEHRILPRPDIERIFRQIEKGPNVENYVNWCREWLGNDPSEDQIQSRRAHFLVKQLYPFKSLLTEFPELWRQYEEAKHKVTEPTIEDYFLCSKPEAHVVIEASPLTEEHLKAKSDEQLLQFLHSWRSVARRAVNTARAGDAQSTASRVCGIGAT